MATTLAQTIYSYLTSHEFRRSRPYPGDDAKALEIIDQAIAANKPIPFMMYWGKAMRDTIDGPEHMAIEFLGNNLGKISEIYQPGVDLKLLFVDTHVKFNGFGWPEDYVAKIEQMFKKNFAGKKGLQVNISLASDHVPFTPTSDGKEFQEFKRLKALATNSDIEPSVAKALAPRAKNYYLRTEDAPLVAGTMYYELCKLEQKPMGEAFKDHIFLTYNDAKAGGKKHFGVPAGMPALCINSLARGIAEKPWNIDPLKFDDYVISRHLKPLPTLPPCELIDGELPNPYANRSIAIVGGGLAGLMSAYQAIETDPLLAITLYEKGSRESYNAKTDDSHRASLGASSARTLRLSGAGAGVGEWNVRETKRVIDALQAEIDTHPADYPELQGKKLFHPQAAIVISEHKDDEYKKLVAGLKRAGANYSELSGAELKARFPVIYATLHDDAVAVVEEPFNAKHNAQGVAGVMDTQLIMQALRAVLQKRDVHIRYDDAVHAIDDKHGPLTIESAQGSACYDHAILAPGQGLQALKNADNRSITQYHGIKPRFDRVVVMDIDFKAMGLAPATIPFTKGFAPEGGKGTFYSYAPDSKDGHVKFLPAVGTSTVETLEALQKPISDVEKDEGLDAASKRFGIAKETLKRHTKFSGCAYICPLRDERMLVAPLGRHMTFAGLDSSGSARVSGGIGRIAANLALGLDEPHAGANAIFSLKEHYKLVNGGVSIDCGKCEKKGICPRPENTTQLIMGGK